MIKIYAVVVIYNIGCESSTTCTSLLSNDDIEVIILDNSTLPLKNAEFCNQKGWQYICMGRNAGLSVAYNKAINVLSNKAGEAVNDSIIVWLDHDSVLPDNYFQVLRQYAENQSPVSIFLPLVYDEISLLSPCRMKNLTIQRCKNVNRIPIEEISAINSGMAVRLSIFKNYRYDERLFLDNIDHAFMRDMHMKKEKIMILPVRINHKFFNNILSSKKSVYNRMIIYLSDFKIFCGMSFYGRVYYFYKTILRGLRLSYRYRSIRFIYKASEIAYKGLFEK